MSAHTDKLPVHLERAMETTRGAFLPAGLSRQLDDLAIATRFPAIIAALVVAAAIDDLRQEVAE